MSGGLPQNRQHWGYSSMRHAQGGAKVAEAAVIYQELGERHNWTGRLYNGAAGCAAAQACCPAIALVCTLESWHSAYR